jgi:hypothetical protein
MTSNVNIVLNGWEAACMYDDALALQETYRALEMDRASDVEWDPHLNLWVACIREAHRNNEETEHSARFQFREDCIAWERAYLNRRALRLATEE